MIDNCGDTSTSTDDPAAYALGIARGVGHPNVRAALDSPVRANRRPTLVSIPIADLIGPDGHEYCEGYRLVGDDLKKAMKDRETYRRARSRGVMTNGFPEPRLEPIPTFEGGVLEFRFVPHDDGTTYGLLTMYPLPKRPEPRHMEGSLVRLDPDRYWREALDAPFATLLRFVDTYCHPEADPYANNGAYPDLIALASRADDDQEVGRFKNELRRALLGDRPPENTLYIAGQFDDGSDEKFLRRLWRDLYPDEPLPLHPTGGSREPL